MRFTELFVDTVNTHGVEWSHWHYVRNGMEEWEFWFWIKATSQQLRIA